MMSLTVLPRRRRPSSIPGVRGATRSASPATALFVATVLLLPLAPAVLLAQTHEIRGKELPAAVRDLPLVELPAPLQPGRPMALVMSGDGNWAHFIRNLSDTLALRGIPVIGLESRAWLKHPRTPEELATDMERVIRYYMKAWSADTFIIVGYSRGADFAPFLANRLPPDLRAKLKGIALFSPTRAANFQFHLVDLLRFVARKSDRPTGPELDRLHDLPVLCVYGRKDKDALCPSLKPAQAEVVARDAGHGLHDPGELADMVIARMGGSDAKPEDR